MPRNLYQREGVWWARFKVNGQSVRRSLRTRSRSVAEKRLKALREQVENELLFGLHGPVGWPAAVVQWADPHHCPVSGKTAARYATSLAMVRRHLDHLSVQQIDAAAVRELVKARQRMGVSNATIRRDLTAVASVLDFAIEEGWITSNPARAYSRKGIPERRDPIILPDDASIAAVVGPRASRFGDMIAFARASGMREEEIGGLRHVELDRRAGTATIVGKRNRLRVVPLSPDTWAIIDRQPRHLKCPYVFWHEAEDARGRLAADRYRNISSNFGDYVDRAERRAEKAAARIGHNGGPPLDEGAQEGAQPGAQFRRFRFHDLRHLFAVEYLREKRGSIYDLQRVLGHTSIKTTEIYLAYLTPEEARAAMFGVSQQAAHDRRFATDD